MMMTSTFYNTQSKISRISHRIDASVMESTGYYLPWLRSSSESKYENNKTGLSTKES